jgi:multisubunit Na+/H+ antiporter MnhF subunit
VDARGLVRAEVTHTDAILILLLLGFIAGNLIARIWFP